MSLTLGVVASPAAAQCEPHWIPNGSAPGTDGSVTAFASFDPDGPGPQALQVYIGGQFSQVTGVPASNIARWDTATGLIEPLGTGVNGSVNAIAVLPNGDVIVGGTFTTAGNRLCRSIARWNGTTWSPLAEGVRQNDVAPGTVNALATLSDGTLVVGGLFSRAGSQPCTNIASWFDDTWSAMGSDSAGAIRAIVVDSHDTIYIGGTFAVTGPPATYGLARWRGDTWEAVPGWYGGNIYGMALHASGDLIVTGDMTVGTSFYNSARFDGAVWTPAYLNSGGFNRSYGRTAAPLANGDVAIVTEYYDGYSTSSGISRWDGEAWTNINFISVSSNNPIVKAVFALPSGDLLVGGLFTNPSNSVSSRGLARITNAGWERFMGDSFNATISTATTLSNGAIVVGGSFTRMGARTMNHVALWNGRTWQSLGDGLPYIVLSLASTPDGEIIAGGWFNVNGMNVSNVVSRWTGNAWEPVGPAMTNGDAGGTSSLNPRINDIAVLDTGDIVVAGRFQHAGGASLNGVARWDGTLWQPYQGTPTLEYYCLLARSPNDIYAGPATQLRHWIDNRWQPVQPVLPSGISGAFIYDLAETPSGDIIAIGRFGAAAGASTENIIRWRGTTVIPTPGLGVPNSPSQSARTIAVVGNDEYYAGGNFYTTASGSANNIVHFHDGAWHPMGAGLNDGVTKIFLLHNGNLFVTGNFTTAGGMPSAFYATWGSSCLCKADLDDGSGTGTRDRAVTIDDLLYYLDRFNAVALAADMDDGTSTGAVDFAVTIDDLLYFLAHFNAGC
ncbi:MAG: hypothetical protein IPK69_07285 [Phycisphaerales bacterium]|nr:MAG: hypothetical protein IPK69_07285 [Phycisphaerales bacterium]